MWVMVTSTASSSVIRYNWDIEHLPRHTARNLDQLAYLFVTCPECPTVFVQSNAEEVARIKDFSRRLAERAQDLNGSCTGEHGIGLGKQDLMERELGVNGVDTMATIKRALDPNLILNPGKVLNMKHFSS